MDGKARTELRKKKPPPKNQILEKDGVQAVVEL